MRATIAMSVAASLSCATVQSTNRGGVVMKVDTTSHPPKTVSCGMPVEWT